MTKQQEKEETEVIEINDDKDSKVGVEVGLEDLSHKELIVWLTKATVSAKSKGSVTASGDGTSYLLFSDEEDILPEDSSTSSGSSGELSEESEDGIDSR